MEPVTGMALEGRVATTVDPAPAVRIRDSDGYPLRGVPVTFGVLSAAGAGSVEQSLVLTGADGIARATWVLGTKSGIQQLTATSPELQSLTFTATAAPGPVARVTQLGVLNAIGGPGSNLGPFSVRVADSFHNPIAGVTVEFEVIAGNGILENDAAVTDSDGVATAGMWTLGVPGINTVAARAAEIWSAPVDALATGSDAIRYVLQSIDGQPAQDRGWSGFVIMHSDNEFFAESRFVCCQGVDRTYRGTGSYAISGGELVLLSDSGDWLEWATEPGTTQSAHGWMTSQVLSLSWFVSGPDYDTVWIYVLTP